MRQLDENGVIDIPGGAAEHNNGSVGGLFLRQFIGNKGVVHEGHAHYVDHATFVYAGKIKITWTSPDGSIGGTVEVGAPNFIPIKAEFFHQIEALEDDTVWYCIFAQAEAEKALAMTEDNGPIPFTMENWHG